MKARTGGSTHFVRSLDSPTNGSAKDGPSVKICLQLQEI